MPFESPFPASVAFAHHPWGVDGVHALAPEERAGLSPQAVLKRQQEYVAGRLAARRALAALQGVATAVPRGADRAPQWPAGVVGAITHTQGHALAAVASAVDCGGLGLDLEHASGVRRPDIARFVADADEQAWIDASDAPARCVAALFSAKESVFKAYYPRAQRWFGFKAVTLRPDPAGDGLHGTLREALGPGAPVGHPVHVRVRWYGDLVLTALWLPPEG